MHLRRGDHDPRVAQLRTAFQRIEEEVGEEEVPEVVDSDGFLEPVFGAVHGGVSAVLEAGVEAEGVDGPVVGDVIGERPDRGHVPEVARVALDVVGVDGWKLGSHGSLRLLSLGDGAAREDHGPVSALRELLRGVEPDAGVAAGDDHAGFAVLGNRGGLGGRSFRGSVLRHRGRDARRKHEERPDAHHRIAATEVGGFARAARGGAYDPGDSRGPSGASRAGLGDHRGHEGGARHLIYRAFRSAEQTATQIPPHLD